MKATAEEVQEKITGLMGKFYIEELAKDREELERAAMKRVCACRYYDLADTLQESSDAELLAIVTKAVPCDTCGE